MSYPSVDALQKAFAQGIFSNRKDSKKAAGRALGTIVELITFYVLREWNLSRHLTIELSLPEFGNPNISHNVEFGLHASRSTDTISVLRGALPITTAKLSKAFTPVRSYNKSNTLLARNEILRNACVVNLSDEEIVTANVIADDAASYKVSINNLRRDPFAMVECKRVGVEEGAKKGPTTIEKAKQGAYVAKHVSAFQKVRAYDGRLFGVMPLPEGGFEFRPWKEELKRLVNTGRPEELAKFVLTVGVVSNHGNWFTSDDPNKELRVLKQSYDWLLFLGDHAIAEFVSETILSSHPSMKEIAEAFKASYTSGVAGSNSFTKVKISYGAHEALAKYISQKISVIEASWFSVLSPADEPISLLKDELHILAGKAW